MTRHPLTFQILAQCKVTKAKCSLMTLPHHVVETPVFMPVGTQVKSLLQGMTNLVVHKTIIVAYQTQFM